MNLNEPIALGRDTFILHNEEQVHDTIRMLYPSVRQCAGIGIRSIADIYWPAIISFHVATPQDEPVAFFHASPRVNVKPSSDHGCISVHMRPDSSTTNQLTFFRQKMDKARADIAGGKAPMDAAIDNGLAEGWEDGKPPSDVPVAQPLDMTALSNILGKTS